MPSNPAPSVPRTADAVIIGGGVMGCAIQYNLARIGFANTVLLERDVLGSGSTGRSQAICRMHYSNAVTTELAWQSLQVFADFDNRVGGTSGFVNTGYLVVVNEADEAGLERNVAMQQELGVPTSVVSRDDLAQVAPMVMLYDDERAAWEPNSGYADPYQVTVSYAARAREAGARILMRTPAAGIETQGDRVRAVVTADGDRIATDTVIVVAGPWSKQVLAGVGVDVPLIPVRHQIATVARPVELVPNHPTVGDISQSFSFRPDGSNFTTMGFGDDNEQSDPDVYPQGLELSEGGHRPGQAGPTHPRHGRRILPGRVGPACSPPRPTGIPCWTRYPASPASTAASDSAGTASSCPRPSARPLLSWWWRAAPATLTSRRCGSPASPRGICWNPATATACWRDGASI